MPFLITSCAKGPLRPSSSGARARRPTGGVRAPARPTSQVTQGEGDLAEAVKPCKVVGPVNSRSEIAVSCLLYNESALARFGFMCADCDIVHVAELLLLCCCFHRYVCVCSCQITRGNVYCTIGTAFTIDYFRVTCVSTRHRLHSIPVRASAYS